MSTATGILDGQGAKKECPKCHSKDLETYLANGGKEQSCPDCGWTSQDQFEFEMVVGG
jgi:ribosomal protein S27AE